MDKFSSVDKQALVEAAKKFVKGYFALYKFDFAPGGDAWKEERDVRRWANDENAEALRDLLVKAEIIPAPPPEVDDPNMPRRIPYFRKSE